MTLAVYYCGVNTVVVLAAIYAQEVMGFGRQESLWMVLIVNLHGRGGAGFGFLQDRFDGRIQTLPAFDASVREEAAQGRRKGKKRAAQSAKGR